MNRLTKLVLAAVGTLSLMAVVGCATQSTSESQATTEVSAPEPEIVIVKSPNDVRSYRYLRLPNQLTAILVHKPEPGKDGAALAVARGSNHDLPDVPGIAHYLEHMLFLGTEKYPDPDGYSDFIIKHGGTYNAFTSNELTNYFFDISPDMFPEALDRFAQFFTAPLLDETYVEREKNAVHSEYQMQMRADGWRGFSVAKTVMNPDHPMSRFSIGSLETLEKADRDMVLEYYKDNYSADQMVLVVVSGRSLDEQEQLVLERFSDVPNTLRGDPPHPPSLYVSESLPLAYGYQTIMSNRNLTLEWPVPDIKPHYKSKPLGYLAFLVGHEGAGSLHELLVDRGWINSLSAGPNRDDVANSSFNVSIGLTEAGWDHVSEIRALVFEYIDMLRDSPIEEWRYQEQSMMNELEFRFISQGSTPATVNRFTQAHFAYEPEDLIRGPYLMTEFNPKLIEEYLGYLTRENVVTSISGPDLETDQTEKWFNVPYTLKPNIDLDYEVEHAFTLPERNPFVPDDISLSEDASNEVPRLILDEEGLEVWHTTDTTFTVPRAVMGVLLRYEEAASSPEDVVHGALLGALLSIAFNADSYPAQMASLSGSFQASSDGLLIGVSGFNDKQHLLLAEMLDLLDNFEIDENQLATQKVELAKSYNNFKDARPFQQAFTTLNHTLVSTSWPPAELSKHIDGVTKESLAAWLADQLDQVAVRMILVGNATAHDAMAIADLLKKQLNLVEVEERLPAVHALDGRYTLNLNIEHNDAVYLAAFQGEEPSFEERAVLRLIEQIITQDYFNQLRTEQQLGYVTIAQSGEFIKHPVMVFLVQSPVADAVQLQEATRVFITNTRENLSNLKQEEFESFREGLLTDLLEPDKNLEQTASRYSRNLRELVKTFDTREQLEAEIKGLTLDDVLAAYDRLLDYEGNNLIEIFSPGEKANTLTSGIAIDNPAAFKSS